MHPSLELALSGTFGCLIGLLYAYTFIIQASSRGWLAYCYAPVRMLAVGGLFWYLLHLNTIPFILLCISALCTLWIALICYTR